MNSLLAILTGCFVAIGLLAYAALSSSSTEKLASDEEIGQNTSVATYLCLHRETHPDTTIIALPSRGYRKCDQYESEEHK